MRNPFRHPNRYKYAWDFVPAGTNRLLDYGCGEGDFMESLYNKVIEIYGMDINYEVLSKARKKCPNIKFFFINEETLPFPENYFDVITLLDVLEHVPNEKDTIRKIYKVLKPNGRLILSVPHKGLFTFLDAGNIKFRFPKLHRFIYFNILKQKNFYFKRFVDTSDGLVGDISISDKMWHKHYNLKELQKIFGTRFEIIFFRIFGLLVPLLSILDYFYRLIIKKDSIVMKHLINLDLSNSFGKASYNIILVCRKGKQ